MAFARCARLKLKAMPDGKSQQAVYVAVRRPLSEVGIAEFEPVQLKSCNELVFGKALVGGVGAEKKPTS